MVDILTNRRSLQDKAAALVPGQSQFHCSGNSWALQARDCKPERAARGWRTHNAVPQITNIIMFTLLVFRDKLSSDTTHSHRIRAQAASNCRETMLTGFIYDSMNSKICRHLKIQKETLHLKQINSK